MKNFITIIFITFFMCATYCLKGQQKIAIAIHGGAGNINRSNISPQMEEAYRQKMEEALKAGWQILEEGGSSLDAITTAIQIMEESPLFNAGKGSVFTKGGKNELDASIMDGKTGQAGAVAGVSTIKNPILAARAVMEHSPHVMLSGSGAERFAEEQGLEIVDPSYFFEKRRWEQFQQIQQQEKERKSKQGSISPDSTYIPLLPESNHKFGTVGAVALDKQGNMAAGTSTGGMLNKDYGRIGDSPIIGAGTYANNATCAVSATGHGEYFIRNVVAYDISALMEYKGLGIEEASHEVIMNKLVKKGGEGGVIAIDKNATITMPFNTQGMFRGFIHSKGEPQVFLFKKD